MELTSSDGGELSPDLLPDTTSHVFVLCIHSFPRETYLLLIYPGTMNAAWPPQHSAHVLNIACTSSRAEQGRGCDPSSGPLNKSQPVQLCPVPQ